ncbi:e1.3 [Tranosema rostrale ichnovirus]|nr:e1.3 [Tranosema rostrale ichnovirus]
MCSDFYVPNAHEFHVIKRICIVFGCSQLKSLPASKLSEPRSWTRRWFSEKVMSHATHEFFIIKKKCKTQPGRNLFNSNNVIAVDRIYRNRLFPVGFDHNI